MSSAGGEVAGSAISRPNSYHADTVAVDTDKAWFWDELNF